MECLCCPSGWDLVRIVYELKRDRHEHFPCRSYISNKMLRIHRTEVSFARKKHLAEVGKVLFPLFDEQTVAHTQDNVRRLGNGRVVRDENDASGLFMR